MKWVLDPSFQNITQFKERPWESLKFLHQICIWDCNHFRTFIHRMPYSSDRQMIEWRTYGTGSPNRFPKHLSLWLIPHFKTWLCPSSPSAQLWRWSLCVLEYGVELAWVSLAWVRIPCLELICGSCLTKFLTDDGLIVFSMILSICETYVQWQCKWLDCKISHGYTLTQLL